MSALHRNSRIFCKLQTNKCRKHNIHLKISQRVLMDKAIRKLPQINTKSTAQLALDKFVNDMHKTNKKIQHKNYKKTVKQYQLKKITTFRDTIDSISSYLCSNWFVVESEPTETLHRNTETYNGCGDITKLFGIYDNLPQEIYQYWSKKPEVDDPIYGLDPDCEAPHLFVNSVKLVKLYKIWGYFHEREIRHRCAMFSYMKAQRRCARAQFWEVFDLEDSFLMELQILAVHLWIIKTRMNLFRSPICNELSYETFRIMFNEFGVRFEKHISGSEIRWESDCQHACIHLAAALDDVWDNYRLNGKHYNPYIFAKVIWSEVYLMNENVSLDVLYLWSKYIFDEMNQLRNVSDFDFLNGWWEFGELPTIEDREHAAKDIFEFMELYENNRSKGNEIYTDRQEIDQVFDEDKLAELAHSQIMDQQAIPAVYNQL